MNSSENSTYFWGKITSNSTIFRGSHGVCPRVSSDGSEIIEIHKKILIFGNVIQKIMIIFGITLFFIIFAPKMIKCMKLVRRTLQDMIEQHLFGGKAILLIGAHQVGKSTLLEQVVKERNEQILRLNCDEPEVREMLTSINSQQLRLLIGSHKIVLIDEAQRVTNVGLTLKLIVDNFPDVQLLVTGSSSLQLRDTINEPLTGRKWEYNLYPLSTGELVNEQGLLGVKQLLETRLIYGSYPDVLNHRDDPVRCCQTCRVVTSIRTCCRLRASANRPYLRNSWWLWPCRWAAR